MRVAWVLVDISARYRLVAAGLVEHGNGRRDQLLLLNDFLDDPRNPVIAVARRG